MSFERVCFGFFWEEVFNLFCLVFGAPLHLCVLLFCTMSSFMKQSSFHSEEMNVSRLTSHLRLLLFVVAAADTLCDSEGGYTFLKQVRRD